MTPYAYAILALIAVIGALLAYFTWKSSGGRHVGIRVALSILTFAASCLVAVAAVYLLLRLDAEWNFAEMFLDLRHPALMPVLVVSVGTISLVAGHLIWHRRANASLPVRGVLAGTACVLLAASLLNAVIWRMGQIDADENNAAYFTAIFWQDHTDFHAVAAADRHVGDAIRQDVYASARAGSFTYDDFRSLYRTHISPTLVRATDGALVAVIEARVAWLRAAAETQDDSLCNGALAEDFSPADYRPAANAYGLAIGKAFASGKANTAAPSEIDAATNQKLMTEAADLAAHPLTEDERTVMETPEVTAQRCAIQAKWLANTRDLGPEKAAQSLRYHFANM